MFDKQQFIFEAATLSQNLNNSANELPIDIARRGSIKHSPSAAGRWLSYEWMSRGNCPWKNGNSKYPSSGSFHSLLHYKLVPLWGSERRKKERVGDKENTCGRDESTQIKRAGWGGMVSSTGSDILRQLRARDSTNKFHPRNTTVRLGTLFQWGWVIYAHCHLALWLPRWIT